MLRGLDKVQAQARDAVASVLERYRAGVLYVQRCYEVQKALAEVEGDMTMQERGRLLADIKRHRDADLAKLKSQAQGALTDMRLVVANLGDDLPEPVPNVDYRQYGRFEVKRAREVLQSLRGG